MPIIPPRLDDRSFDDLVAELVARIPAHTPEWTHVRPGDPGRTLLELFAWLGDTILYRANLVPERQRLQFLRLLGMPLRPAVPARGIVGLDLGRNAPPEPRRLRPGAVVAGPVPFETITDITVLPVTARAFAKRTPTKDELAGLGDLIDTLAELYGIDGKAAPYVTSPVYVDGAPSTDGFDLVGDSVDGSLWLALLVEPGADTAATIAAADAMRTTLRTGVEGRPVTLNLGVVPAVAPIEGLDALPARGRVAHVWEATTGRVLGGRPEFAELEVISDGTRGLARDGVVRVLMPGGALGAPPNDVESMVDAGTGQAAPRLDDPALEARLVTWIRLRLTERVERLPLSWLTINAVEVDGRRTLKNRVVAQADGTADLLVSLPARSIEPETLAVEVEMSGRGFVPWSATSDLGLAGRDDTVYTLDPEAGELRFGDGVRGRVPEPAARIRVVTLRAGGGPAGNLPPGSLEAIDGQPIVVRQPLPTRGGMAAETMEDAELRIPGTLRHRHRAVTEYDFRTLAAATPGVELGRVEILPKFKPHQRRTGVPGVVSVMVLPFKAERVPPNPRPDRMTIEWVHAHLDQRRLLGTELYVIGTEYRRIGLGTSIRLRDGFAREDVLRAVRDAVRTLLWPLSPGGVEGGGWPLDTDVSAAEIEVAIARVAGVRAVGGVTLFVEEGERWVSAPKAHDCAPQVVEMGPWQLPELMAISVVAVSADEALPEPPTALDTPPGPYGDRPGIPVPIVPEVC